MRVPPRSDFNEQGVRFQKRCSKCGETKPITEFGTRAGGFVRSACRVCRRAEEATRDQSKKRLAKHNWYRQNRQRYRDTERAYERERRYTRRYRVLCHYGGEPPRCACCGETELEFMSLDHMNNDGSAHRRTVGRGIVDWIIRNGYPTDFQVLCYNCNFARGHHASLACPHQRANKNA